MLASQKFKVVPLQARAPASRKQEIAAFLGEVQRLEDSLSGSLETLQGRRESMAGHYTRERRKIEDYYAGLVRQIELTRDRTLSALELTSQKEQQLVSLYLD
jgi:hypothetical protein